MDAVSVATGGTITLSTAGYPGNMTDHLGRLREDERARVDSLVSSWSELRPTMYLTLFESTTPVDFDLADQRWAPGIKPLPNPIASNLLPVLKGNTSALLRHIYTVEKAHGRVLHI